MSATREPTILQALLPIGVLTALLGLAVYLFGADASYGPNQIGLLAATAVALAVGARNGIAWKNLQDAVARSITVASGAIFILLVVGSVIGVWILSGTVPTLIHYGLALLNPSVFYLASCLICALIGLAIGSSWTVAGTIGIGLMGVAQAQGLNPGMAAGAIISGAYFGDKMSPLSDTTNLAPAVAGSELFEHIRHMTWTTLPAFVVALILFGLIGINAAASDISPELARLPAVLAQEFALGPHLLLPMILVLVMAWRRIPALICLAVGVVAGAVFAVLFQPEQVARIGAALDRGAAMAMVSGVWQVLFSGYSGESGLAALDELLNRGGMANMMNTVWIILCALAFGGAMEKSGLLQRLILSLMRRVKTAGGLVATTVLTAFGINAIASDQYISIVISGRMYKLEYERLGLDSLNLSRAVEDGGTVTSVLVPWNSCGAYMAATLGVSTWAYAPYAFLNWICPVLAVAMALTGFRILRQQGRAAQPAC